jgi:MSHA biogenesis protein MshN
MSLINQVLQDLEKRHASEPELKSLPPHVRAVPEGPRPGGNTPLFVTAALIVFAIVAGFLYFGGWLRPASKVPVAAAVAPAAPVLSAADVVEARPAAPAPVVQAQSVPPASRLSAELSFVPDSRPPREPVSIPEKPAAPKPSTPTPSPQVKIPAEFRAAIEPPPAALAAVPEPAAPRVPAPPAPVAPVPASPVSPVESPVVIDKQMREMTPQQRAEAAFRKGVAQLQEARASAAEASFREALREDQNHVAARQALLGLLLDAKRNDEAEQLLKKALELNPRQPRHAMVLARLEVERGEVTGAITTLVAALPYVQSDPEYYAFLAALLQREGRHREAADYYRAALRSSPGNALWLMGLGISLRATSQFAEARDSFQRSIDTRQLSGELLAFTERQLRELSAPKK